MRNDSLASGAMTTTVIVNVQSLFRRLHRATNLHYQRDAGTRDLLLNGFSLPANPPGECLGVWYHHMHLLSVNVQSRFRRLHRVATLHSRQDLCTSVALLDSFSMAG